ncbi:MAG TPA: S49 family peptidase [Crenotrichaceae bacterium]|nr:MAG: peptidase S49 [Methylothermaceae bacteria B42]HFD12733.1 S49 family peptidase [Crenotrichaceae bacterium]
MSDSTQQNSNDLTTNPGWEKTVLEKIALSAIEEQKRARHWSTFFKLLTFLYLALVLYKVFVPGFGIDATRSGGSHTAVIDVVGMITEDSESNADRVTKGLREAADDKATKGIILRMNTPGGTPVQSAYIYDEIRRIKQQHPELPIISVVSDICASGGYYVASAADKIFVNKSSLIGSIGVLLNGFGFVDTMKKLGVERRLLTAGSHKGIMDPFLPMKKDDQEHVEHVLSTVHQHFIDAVKAGRGERLHADPRIFTGLFWSGEEGIQLGLADGVGTVRSIAEQEIGETNLVNFTPQENLLDRLGGKFKVAFRLAIQEYASGISIQ